MEKDNLEGVKKTAKLLFAAVPLEGHPDFGALIVSHPFTETALVPLRLDDGTFTFINLLEDKDGAQKWQQQCFYKIDSLSTIHGICYQICKAWRLTFLKYAKPYLTKDTFSELFADVWTGSENPNMDANCTLKEMIGWFKNSNKKKLMEEEEYSVWENLPNKFEVYRGVAKGRAKYGLSWTRNLDTAEWFANRWDGDCYILKATIEKKHALAYFNSRDEDEIVVDVFAIKKDIEIL